MRQIKEKEGFFPIHPACPEGNDHIHEQIIVVFKNGSKMIATLCDKKEGYVCPVEMPVPSIEDGKTYATGGEL